MRTHGNKSAFAYAFLFVSRMCSSAHPLLTRILFPQRITPPVFPQPLFLGLGITVYASLRQASMFAWWPVWRTLGTRYFFFLYKIVSGRV